MRKSPLRVPKKAKEFLVGAGLWWSIATVIALGGALMLEVLWPTPVKPLSVIYLFGVPLFSWVPGFLLVAVGVGWMIHGVGFLLVRR